MPNQRITELNGGTLFPGVVADNDVLAFVDVSNTTDHVSGSSFPIAISKLAGASAFSNAYATAAQGATADSALQSLVGDTTPQLGGNLDLNGNVITGLQIGTDVQAYAAALDSVSGTNTGDEVAATALVSGVVELATIAEVDTGTDPERAITPAGLAGSALASAVSANTAKVTNATHTGEVTGATALTIDPTAISGKTLVTAVAADHVLILDDTDGALKKAVVSDLGADNFVQQTGAPTGDAAVLWYDTDATPIDGPITSASTTNDLTNITAITYTGTTDTLALTDAGALIYYSNASQVTVTIPTNASVAFATGTRMVLMSTGAGGLTLTTTSLTLLGSSPNLTIAQNEALYIEKIATDTWAVVGGTSA